MGDETDESTMGSFPELTEDQGRIVQQQAAAAGPAHLEELLRSTQEQFRLVLDTSRDMIYQLDLATGRYAYVSPAAFRILGYDTAEIRAMGRQDLDGILHPDDCRRFARRSEELMQLAGPAEQSFTIEYRLRHKDGRYVWFRDRHTLVLGPGGRGRYIVGVAREITEEVEARQLLEEARRRLAVAVEDERRRLAGELHDSIGQHLVAVRLSLQALRAEAPAVRERADHALALCGQAIAEVRRICRGLYPPVLERLGLLTALEQLADGHARDNVEVLVSAPDGLAQVSLSEHVKISLFRICQEAASNAVRHGRADRVRIDLRLADGRLVLTVSDNGCGFDPSSAPTGLGIPQMQNRAASCGGELRISSRPGRTRIETSVPMEPAGSLPRGRASAPGG